MYRRVESPTRTFLEKLFVLESLNEEETDAKGRLSRRCGTYSKFEEIFSVLAEFEREKVERIISLAESSFDKTYEEAAMDELNGGRPEKLDRYAS